MDPAEQDSEKSISRSKYGVSGIPTTFVIDKEGKIVQVIVGYLGETDKRLEKALEKAGLPHTGRYEPAIFRRVSRD